MFLMMPLLALAQTRITGTVTDTKNEPLPGASVKQKGTGNGTSTDGKGAFTLTLREGSSTLSVSIVGYKSKEVSTVGKSILNVVLEEDNNSLSEVVAIGYQNIQRKNTAGAISSVKGKDFENTPYSRLMPCCRVGLRA